VGCGAWRAEIVQRKQALAAGAIMAVPWLCSTPSTGLQSRRICGPRTMAHARPLARALNRLRSVRQSLQSSGPR